MRTIQERFEAKFVKSDGCWEWTACKNRDGYGRFGFGGGNAHAHRVAYQLYVGVIPDGLFVLHRCDNCGCVRPDHLFLGTNDDNMQDCKNKGRRVGTQTGEKNGNAKLTEEQVKTIRARSENGARNPELAIVFGVSCQAISHIICHRSWAKI